jgi:hypothetical protein
VAYYDLDTRRLLCRERAEELAQEARGLTVRRRHKRARRLSVIGLELRLGARRRVARPSL